jgi:hypothetical protein
VDVQSNFKKYFPNDPNSYLKRLDAYCEDFPVVYQYGILIGDQNQLINLKIKKILLKKNLVLKVYIQNLKRALMNGFKLYLMKKH